ncbi:probable RNA polymerase II nuclear localization protein SLC7A6OS isoform X2 [Hyalella azteca]|uniref:Probable RNA polymerase II nuclear localization protein SLC7A6OS n=1 Tax=Hyalella azteca TaxID=294128 RepID=A0A979FIU4_HYAAZ|nr:probable RNA polymerase II nuclear localization protein SLC7A6OS isoform X2 [Hyalella azteca]
MDYKIICVKRPLESEPLDEINVNCKRSKLETPFTLPLVTTLKSKEENLAPVIKNIILKCKQEKLQRLQEQKGLSYSDLFKYKTNKLKPRKTTVNSAASSKRYQIVNKRRGLDELDMESRQFLATTDRFKLGLGGSSDCRNDQKSLPSTPDETKNCASSDDGLNIEVLDVDIIPPEEDMICMNGVPLENSFVYDIFLTQVPQGFAAEDFDIYQAANAPVYMPDNDEDDEDGNESEDSNAENFYGNDYPDEESSDDAESDDEVMNSRSRCWYAWMPICLQ